MRSPVFVITVLAAALVSCGGGTSGSYSAPPQAPGQVPPNTTIVNIPPGATGKGIAAFGANPLAIRVGMTVTWVNQDAVAHTSTSDTGVWDSGTIGPGQNFSFTFSVAGTFPYHCMIHGAASMSGTVQVSP